MERETIMKKDSSGSVRISKSVQEAVQTGALDPKGCDHIATIQDVTPSADGCEDCLKMGDSWVHLRLCLTCGYVGCCDNSKNKHATAHHHGTSHPMIVSYEEGENWMWCYPDKVLIKA
jgi:uncharacterized UBP type Zn finger protein